jgi:hypothetical protein
LFNPSAASLSSSFEHSVLLSFRPLAVPGFKPLRVLLLGKLLGNFLDRLRQLARKPRQLYVSAIWGVTEKATSVTEKATGVTEKATHQPTA